jgi:hypothetical protein
MAVVMGETTMVLLEALRMITLAEEVAVARVSLLLVLV